MDILDTTNKFRLYLWKVWIIMYSREVGGGRRRGRRGGGGRGRGGGGLD